MLSVDDYVELFNKFDGNGDASKRLDPAEPNFKGKDKSIILDPSDAHFVDVIHSDGTPFVGLQGFGLANPAGHVDFYPNGGQHQPGCSQDPLGSAIGDILHGGLSGVSKDLSCSHGRSHDFYVESILSHCPFRGHPCNSFEDFSAGKCTGCGSHGCAMMGFPAHSQGPKGKFYLATRPKTPYCGYEYYIELRMASRNMEITYGDVFVTLIGSKGQSEETRFLRGSQKLAKGTTERYVVSVAKDVGTISQVKIRFNRVTGFVAFGTTDDFAVHSITVRPEAGGSSRKLCGHDELVHGTRALTSQSGC
ncbi:inactive pancreatic lipase-related protein 1-like [Liolophura sinensis]|uniref:inactive pancreatic lipase-related protein 1-like n=1 Tax=Liolophura sinensis TaxID=3198878 RepID=UPI003158DB31